MITVFDFLDMLDGTMINDNFSVMVISTADKTVLYHKTMLEYMHESNYKIESLIVDVFRCSSTCIVLYV